MVFRMTEQEFSFLRVFCEIPELAGFPDLSDPKMAGDPQISIAGLESKGYLGRDEEGKYFLANELTFIMDAANKSITAFSAAGRDRTLAGYFVGDTIILITKKKEYEVMWLPNMPLLIGAVADFMGPYLNEKTSGGKEYSGDKADEMRKELLSSGWQKSWEVSVYTDGLKDADTFIEVYENVERQIEMMTKEKKLEVSEPDKADLVNSVTAIMAPLHADAIKRGEEV